MFWTAARDIRFHLLAGSPPHLTEDSYSEIETIALHSDYPVLRDRASEILDERYRIFGMTRQA